MRSRAQAILARRAKRTRRKLVFLRRTNFLKLRLPDV
jgi:hypothetical protein